MAQAKRGVKSKDGRPRGGASKSKLIVATKAAALASHRKQLGVLQRLIQRRLGTVAESFYDVGEALREIVDKKLYAAGGYTSLAAYLTATKLIAVSHAEKLIAIVRGVPREEALAAGQERAAAMLALVAATPEADTAAELIARGTVDGEPAKTASVRAIRAAAKAHAARRPKTPAQAAKVKADAAVDKGLRAWLKQAGLRADDVRVTAATVRVVLPRALVDKLLGRDG